MLVSFVKEMCTEQVLLIHTRYDLNYEDWLCQIAFFIGQIEDCMYMGLHLLTHIETGVGTCACISCAKSRFLQHASIVHNHKWEPLQESKVHAILLSSVIISPYQLAKLKLVR
jgi:hypothetical protein